VAVPDKEVREAMPTPTCTRLACALALGISGAGLLTITDLQHGSLHVPLNFTNDSMLYLPLVKGLHENGWHLTNPRLAAPDGYHLYDFPMADNFHFLTLKVLCLISGDPIVAFNLFLLLQFPAAALTGTWVLRQLGLGVLPAVVGGVLFAYLPHHCNVYSSHIFLGCYYPVPLAILVVVRVFTGKLQPLARDPETGRLRPPYVTGSFVGALAVGALVASTGAYYAFFTCALLLAAAAANALERRRLVQALPGALLTGVVFAGLVANLAPAILFHRAHGPNPEIKRYVPEGNTYALRPAELLLPMPHHRIERLAKVPYEYISTFGPTVVDGVAVISPLGAAGAFGLLYGLVVLLRRRADTPGEVHQQIISRLLVVTLLIAVAGGFGPLFNYLVSTWVRCYYRIAVFTGFLALTSLALLLDRVATWSHGRSIGPVVQAGLLALVGVGLYDQTSPKCTHPYEARVREFRADREFVRTVERTLPVGAAVFQLPYMKYPESGPVEAITDYHPFTPYIHSENLRWSYGATKGRPTALWQESVVVLQPEPMARALALGGFEAVWVDRWGYPGHVAPVEAGLAPLADGPPLVSPDGRHAVYRLVVYRERILQGVTEVKDARRASR
jgi:hypothetical protein